MKPSKELQALAVDVARELAKHSEGTRRTNLRDAFDHEIDLCLIGQTSVPPLSRSERIKTLRKALRAARAELNTGSKCCTEALTGKWEPSGEGMQGFEDWREMNDRAIAAIDKVLL